MSGCKNDGMDNTNCIWDEKAASRYDAEAKDMFAEDVVSSTVNFLKKLAGNGKALEFAVGTGRIAIPLLESGLEVHGIDSSEPMVSKLHEKIDADRLPVVIGDMTKAKVDEQFSLVYLIFNGISNVLTPQEQIDCFVNAADHLVKGGRFVIELWIPELRKLPPGQEAVVWQVEPDHIGLDTYDLINQHVTSHHFRFDKHGHKTEVFRSKHRYAWPSELDLMGKIAGFRLENRFSSWNSDPFDFQTRCHVSVYIKEGSCIQTSGHI